MKKELIGIFVCMLLIGTVLPATGNIITYKSNLSSTNGNILYVGGTGEGNYTTIQSAINDATDGDTVYVYDDSSPYYELLVIDKSINLIGENKMTTVVDGDLKGTVVKIITNDVTVSGLTIRNSFYPCISLQSSSNTFIHDNIIYQVNITNRQDGIEIVFLSTFNNISNNEIFGFDSGIVLASNDNIIYGNNIYQNDMGIVIFGDNNNKIINNLVTENKWVGILMLGGRNNQISGNTITNNGWAGGFGGIGTAIDSFKDGNNYITDNIITNNSQSGINLGLHVSFPIELGPLIKFYITDNDISNNKVYGIFDCVGGKSIVARNNLIDNPTNAYFVTFNLFRKNTLWINNYWSDYTGGSFYKINGKFFFFFSWFNIDWHPAKEPYDIGI